MMRDGKWDWKKLGVYKDKKGNPTGSFIDGKIEEAKTPNDKE